MSYFCVVFANDIIKKDDVVLFNHNNVYGIVGKVLYVIKDTPNEEVFLISVQDAMDSNDLSTKYMHVNRDSISLKKYETIDGAFSIKEKEQKTTSTAVIKYQPVKKVRRSEEKEVDFTY